MRLKTLEGNYYLFFCRQLFAPENRLLQSRVVTLRVIKLHHKD